MEEVDGGTDTDLPARWLDPRGPGRSLVAVAADAAPGQSGPCDEVLARWEKAGADLKTVDVTFRRIDRSPAWPAPRLYEGRLILKAPNLASVELRAVTSRVNPEGFDRFVWKEDQVFEHVGTTRQVFAFPRPHPGELPERADGPFNFSFQHRGRTPRIPSLPFLFRTSADELRGWYEVELLGEEPSNYVIQLAPRATNREWDLTRAVVLLLNKHSFRPEAFHVLSPDGKDIKTYIARAARYNEPVADSVFALRVPHGWRLHRVSLAPGSSPGSRLTS